MRPFLYSFLILFPVLVWNQKCPTFQAVIPLRPSATALNLSYAMVADGKYYFVGFHDQKSKHLEPIGVMPEGFEESRLITVIDRSDCNDSQYYLIAIKSFRWTVDSVQSMYSTLDLKNWEPTTKWSEPKPLSTHPLFANDPYIQLFKQFDPNLEIENFVHILFYWEQTQTHFVVTKPFQRYSTEPIKSSALRYYLIDAQKSCDQNYEYSKTPESLSLALNRVIEPLDLCFFSHHTDLSDPLLYCVGGQAFQVNSITTEYTNGSVRSENVGTPEHMPTIDRLRVLGSICVKESKGKEEERIRVRIDQIKVAIPDSPDKEVTGKIIGQVKVHPFDYPTPKGIESTSETPEAEDSSSTFIIVLICLAIFVVIMIGILIIAARRQQQIAKM